MGRDQDKSQAKSQGRDHGQGLNKTDDSAGGNDHSTDAPGTWNDRAQRDMQQGDLTRPAQPDGTSPLDKDEHPINKNRSGQQHR